MTIEEFRKQNPNSHGNLCWNCIYWCHSFDRHHNGDCCVSFEKLDPKNFGPSNAEQRAHLMKVIREEHNSIMGDASNYFYTKIYKRR